MNNLQELKKLFIYKKIELIFFIYKNTRGLYAMGIIFI